LADETVSVLEAVQFLEGLGSLQEVIGPLVERFARDRARDSAVKKLLDQRTRYRHQGSLWDERK
jgi:hypothetical protein